VQNEQVSVEAITDELNDLNVQKDLEPTPQDQDGEDASREPLDVELHPIPSSTDTAPEAQEPPPPSDLQTAPEPTASPPTNHSKTTPAPLYDDPSDSDDGEGEWITPSNVAVHKSRALSLLPAEANGKSSKIPAEQIGAGCMTADFAMQNVLLQMGLKLVSVDGKRIERVKNWVLRCHACFKYVFNATIKAKMLMRLWHRICKDSSRKFCPTCGNPTLLRASVTIAAPDAAPGTPAMQVHLKKNFQYKLRGTVYSIPAPKPGSAKTGPGEGLILREDQAEFMRANKRVDGAREKDERKMLSGALARGAKGEEGGVSIGNWMDPDWVPEMLSVGAGGKGRTMKGQGEMPSIGYGRKNPNERRRKK
jgi:RNA-binding protein NOB1